MTEIRILLFGRAKEIAGTGEIAIASAPGQTTAAVLSAVVARYPLLAPWKDHLRMAVNQEYAHAEREVHPGDEIALIPPVSGG